jgi:phospholipid/cholesterol/gamma-HCH transport system substrate-binding protein
MRRVRNHSYAFVACGLVAVATALIGLMFFAGFWRAGDKYRVSAYVANARGIAVNSTVFEAGLPVGMVTAIKRNGPDAILRLRIDKGVTPLPVDSKLSLGVRSLAGETDVLLTPGQSAQTVKDDGSLGLSQNEPYTEVDQILNELSGTTRGDARQFFQGLGNGVDGEGENLNQTLGGFADLVNESPPLTSTLADQHEDVADIVQNFGNIMVAIRDRSAALQAFAHGSRVTFETTAAHEQELRNTLKVLPYVATTNDTLVAAINRYGPAVSHVVDHLASTMERLKPTLDLLGPASAKGLSTLRALADAAPPLRNVLGDLEDLQPAASKALPAINATLCQANPALRFAAPYSKEILQFFANFGSMTDAYVPGAHRGHLLLTSANVDPPHFVRGLQSQPNSAALTTLYNLGVFSPVANSDFGYHSLLPPGDNDDPQDLHHEINGPPGWRAAGHTYPHVTACKR